MSNNNQVIMNEIRLQVIPGYTGRLTVYVEGGELKAARPYNPDEITASFSTFIEMAKRAGFVITQPGGEPA